LRHFLLMVLFAALVALVFGTVGRENIRERFTYGAKIFAEFVGIGLALGWILFWLPL